MATGDACYRAFRSQHAPEGIEVDLCPLDPLKGDGASQAARPPRNLTAADAVVPAVDRLDRLAHRTVGDSDPAAVNARFGVMGRSDIPRSANGSRKRPTKKCPRLGVGLVGSPPSGL